MSFLVCLDCETFLENLSRFSEMCTNTKELLIHLRKMKIDDEDEIASLRSSYLSNEYGMVLVDDHAMKEEPVEEEVLSEGGQMEVIIEDGGTQHYIIEQEDLDPEDHEEIVEDEEEEEQSNISFVDSKPTRTYNTRGVKGSQNPVITDRRKTPQKRPPRPKTEADAFKLVTCRHSLYHSLITSVFFQVQRLRKELLDSSDPKIPREPSQTVQRSYKVSSIRLRSLWQALRVGDCFERASVCPF